MRCGRRVGACLEGSTNDHNDGAGENSLATTEVIPDPDTEDCAEETTQVV